jgi:hypothetical protein
MVLQDQLLQLVQDHPVILWDLGLLHFLSILFLPAHQTHQLLQ